ncbi:hypothetical protein K443DRAFT_13116 [Laccaria amethystina LaAM-08-1]|uniref:Uncharacterized protein n=1 Tax=Laccaria amethystina LaAM-08-1 TaxID=1095629 RepID=A0A0C9WWC5_9AGAR|nr:hypothetical protein K443DRAFT_13116 [Laccaria amethystina LaAM-08-1]
MANQPKDSSLKRPSGIKEGFARLLSPKSRPAHRVIGAAALDELGFDGDEEEEEEEDRERGMQMTDHPSCEITTSSLTTATAVNSSANQDNSEETTNTENIPSTPVESTPQPPVSGPYTPKSISLYGRGDESDDEFGTTIRGVPFPQPVVYHYPDAHPDLEKFPRSELLAALQLIEDEGFNTSSSPRDTLPTRVSFSSFSLSAQSFLECLSPIQPSYQMNLADHPECPLPADTLQAPESPS